MVNTATNNGVLKVVHDFGYFYYCTIQINTAKAFKDRDHDKFVIPLPSACTQYEYD